MTGPNLSTGFFCKNQNPIKDKKITKILGDLLMYLGISTYLRQSS